MLTEIRDTLKELLRSNQIIIQSNNELKKLFHGEYGLRENTLNENPTESETLPYSITAEDSSGNVNVDLFKRIITVYFNEEVERIKSNNVRKSARRVSVELGGTMCDFLNQHLQGTGLKFKRFPDGLIIVRDGDKEVGAIKVLSDIGFHRGKQWFEYVEEIVEHCSKKYEIENDHIFFVIASLRNGLDQKHVSKLLNRDIRSNWVFMNNRPLVDEYVNKFIDLTTFLPDPQNQIYIMASELHPNVIADDLHKMNEQQKKELFKQVEEYNWISDLNDFLDALRHLI